MPEQAPLLSPLPHSQCQSKHRSSLFSLFTHPSAKGGGGPPLGKGPLGGGPSMNMGGRPIMPRGGKPRGPPANGIPGTHEEEKQE